MKTNPAPLTNRFAAVAALRAAFLTAAALLWSGGPGLQAANFIATAQQSSGAFWDSTSFWNPGGLTATATIAGDPAATFELKIGSRMRSPNGSTFSTFPGTAANTLTADGTGLFFDPNTAGTLYNANESEIRFKQGGSSDLANGATGNPGFGVIVIANLIMNGGLLDTGNAGTVVLTNGVITVTNGYGTNMMSYFYNDGFLDRGFQIYSQLAGSANLGTHMYAQNTNFYESAYNHACRIMGTNNTFTGQWEVMGGVLVGGATNVNGDGCLGTNTITVDAAGVLETTYNINNPNANLILNGQMYLTQDDTFRSVIINGAPLPVGTYSATLFNLYTNFPGSWTPVMDAVANTPDPSTISGSITVLSANTTPIVITNPPANLRVLSGQTATFTVGFSGPFTSIQWLSNNVAVAGANGLSYTTPPVTAAATYKVTVANNINSVSASAALSIGTLIPAPGFLADLVWMGAQYTQDSIQTTPNPPTTSGFLGRLDAGAHGSAAYGEQVNGLFTPASSGNYVFFVCADDTSELYLSTDSTPANTRLIAVEDAASNPDLWTSGGGTLSQNRSDQYSPDGGITVPFAAGIPLVAGTPYYIEADHSQISGGANVGAYFKLISDPDPAAGTPSDLAGSLISTMAIDGGSLSISNAPQPASAVELHTASFTVSVQAVGSAAALGALSYQWQRAGVNIPGANQGSYVTPVLHVSDNNAQFDVVVSMPGVNAVTSAPVTLTVTVDHAAPVIAENPGAVANRNGAYEVSVVFNKPILITSATNLANYQIAGATITGAQLFPNTGLDRTWPAVVLTATGLNPASTCSLTVSGVTDLTSAANVIAMTNIQFSTSQFSWAAIGATDFYLDNLGNPTTNAVPPWEALGVGTNGFDLINAGQSFGIFDNAPTEDDITFAYIPVTNDFDVVAQISYADPAIADPSFGYSQVGLMVRDYIEFPGPTSGGGASQFQSIAVTPAADYKGSAQVQSHVLSVGRETFGSAATDPNTTGPSAPIINLIPAPFPNVWLRIKRTLTATNDIITLYHSADGVTWLGSGDQNMVLNGDPATDMSSNVYVGVFYAATAGPTPIGSIQDWAARVRNFGSFATVAALPAVLTNARVSNGQVSFSFNSQLGVNYTVQATATLSPANWQPVGGVISGTGGIINVSNALGAGPLFYRVMEQASQ